MSTERGDGEAEWVVVPTAREGASADPPVRLEAVVVSYADRPDRRTIYPPGLSSVARMSTWLTADADAFVDLAEWR